MTVEGKNASGKLAELQTRGRSVRGEALTLAWGTSVKDLKINSNSF